MLASLLTVNPKHRIGHSFMALGAVSFLMLSLIMSVFPSSKAAAFGVGEIVDLSNQARSQSGIQALSVNDQLTAAAQAKADHMLANRYFEHTAPDGTTGWYFIKQKNYPYKTAGENLAATNENAAAVVDGWMNSPGHRANLLNTKYSEVGYGMVYYGDFEQYENVYFVVALYGEPIQQAAPVAATPSPTPAAAPPTSTPTEPIASSPTVLDSQSALESKVLTLEENVSPSGTIKVVEKSAPAPSSTVLLLLAVISGCLLVIGVVLEIRHLLHNHTLFPHTPHHA